MTPSSLSRALSSPAAEASRRCVPSQRVSGRASTRARAGVRCDVSHAAESNLRSAGADPRRERRRRTPQHSALAQGLARASCMRPAEGEGGISSRAAAQLEVSLRQCDTPDLPEQVSRGGRSRRAAHGCPSPRASGAPSLGAPLDDGAVERVPTPSFCASQRQSARNGGRRNCRGVSDL